jgi:ABC-type uncharacterized transport system permease subunit
VLRHIKYRQVVRQTVCMRFLKPLLLLAGAFAVVGFVLVAIGTNRGHTTFDDIPDGWYAYDPATEPGKIADDPDAAYSSTFSSVTFDDESSVSTLSVVGFGLVGTSFLLTAGMIGYWAVKRPRPTA